MCVPSLYGTGKAAASGGADNVDMVAYGKHVALELLSDSIFGAIVEAKLSLVLFGGDAGLLEAAELGLVDILFFDIFRSRLLRRCSRLCRLF